jgi:hypothetical protein
MQGPGLPHLSSFNFDRLQMQEQCFNVDTQRMRYIDVFMARIAMC